jgi:microcystin-dependent protein
MTFTIPSEGVADSPSVCVSVNKTWVGYVLGVLEKLNRDSTWEGDENAVYDVRQQVESLMEAFANGSEVCMVPIGGTLIWFAETIPPNYLRCDGELHNKSDYPDLYALLEGIVAETSLQFETPNFNLRLPMGAGTNGLFTLAIGEPVGDLEHEISTGEMPEHHHSIPAHSHTTQAHTHIQNAHTHLQNSHGHSASQAAHNHDVSVKTTSAAGAQAFVMTSNNSGTSSLVTTSSETPAVTVNGTTATNQNTTATNQDATVTVNEAAATNTGNAGSGTPMSILNPVRGVVYIIRAK